MPRRALARGRNVLSRCGAAWGARAFPADRCRFPSSTGPCPSCRAASAERLRARNARSVLRVHFKTAWRCSGPSAARPVERTVAWAAPVEHAGHWSPRSAPSCPHAPQGSLRADNAHACQPCPVDQKRHRGAFPAAAAQLRCRGPTDTPLRRAGSHHGRLGGVAGHVRVLHHLENGLAGLRLSRPGKRASSTGRLGVIGREGGAFPRSGPGRAISAKARGGGPRGLHELHGPPCIVTGAFTSAHPRMFIHHWNRAGHITLKPCAYSRRGCLAAWAVGVRSVGLEGL